VGEEASAIADAAVKAGHSGTQLASSNAMAAGILSRLLAPGDLVLLKASRSGRMEQILQHLT
jgi:UDP-N-acetylmuramoyl-tripeptide--D-alanyl-D-alanine ligase